LKIENSIGNDMSSILEFPKTKDPDRPGTGKRVGILGVPLGFGASIEGVELGPRAMRVAHLKKRIENLGYAVRDLGNMNIRQPDYVAEEEENPKYLSEMIEACEQIATDVYSILNADELPVILGGDHSIAIGSISGVTSYFHEHNQTVGLIWFDAHADMNAPETSPSGNIHGMPLAILLGSGPNDLVNLKGFAPKLNPHFCAHIGARDLDKGEKELIRRLGIRFFTMREIDERGMSACVDEAIAIASQASAGYAVTFDVDALDPNFAPGSGTLVRGGLTYREAHLALEKIADDKRMLSLEVVEINTALDINNTTAELGVELILSALGKSIL
jgi:arginase